jgi:hypothetical protein
MKLLTSGYPVLSDNPTKNKHNARQPDILRWFFNQRVNIYNVNSTKESDDEKTTAA